MQTHLEKLCQVIDGILEAFQPPFSFGPPEERFDVGAIEAESFVAVSDGAQVTRLGRPLLLLLLLRRFLLFLLPF